MTPNIWPYVSVNKCVFTSEYLQSCSFFAYLSGIKFNVLLAPLDNIQSNKTPERNLTSFAAWGAIDLINSSTGNWIALKPAVFSRGKKKNFSHCIVISFLHISHLCFLKIIDLKKAMGFCSEKRVYFTRKCKSQENIMINIYE